MCFGVTLKFNLELIFCTFFFPGASLFSSFPFIEFSLIISFNMLENLSGGNYERLNFLGQYLFSAIVLLTKNPWINVFLLNVRRIKPGIGLFLANLNEHAQHER